MSAPLLLRMEHNADLLRKATQHLQQLLLSTPGKSQQHAYCEAEAIARLAFVDGNPVRELFATANARAERDRPRSPSPTGTIRPKSSKGFFNKFSRGRDKATSASASSSSSSAAKQATIDGVTPEFMHVFGPIEDRKPKRKERSIEIPAPSTGAGAGRSAPATSFGAQQKAARSGEQWKCIVCDQDLSSKGVCKRHLEDQHVAPRVFECEGCHISFDTKAEAKKHCSQCGEGQHDFASRKMPSKTVYACEFSGGYFTGQTRYVEHLLGLSEQKDPRPKPDLNLKLEAILRHWSGRTQGRVLMLCREISQGLFGSPDAWTRLQWDHDFLHAKILILEYATFNDDGTVESPRFGGLQSEQRRSTESFLTQLLQAGKLTAPNGKSPYKPSPMSICTTPAAIAQPAPSATSGHSSIETPQSGISPFPRSDSRQTVWSQDGLQRSTTASTTPRSVSTGDEVMSAELKSKRHLSDESRLYMPSRTPPGPPEPSELYQYQTDPSALGQAPQLPPLPSFVTPSNSSVSLPLRKHESHGIPATQHMAPQPQYHQHLYHMHPANSSHILTSDVASETSTLANSYREPEFLGTVPDNYLAWSQQQQQQHFAYQHSQQQHPPFGYGYDYSMADDTSSMVASSINTGNTVDVDYVTELPKMESYSDMELSNHHGPTFYLPGDDDEHQRAAMR